MALEWSNPNEVDIEKGAGFLYFIRVYDCDGIEYRYIGKTKRGRSRLREYRRNVERIFDGKPRRVTPGQERYRAVHLALAKAIENGWCYEFYPLENVAPEKLNTIEKERISELGCFLNVGQSWEVSRYHELNIRDLL